MIEKLLSPVIIDLTCNYEYIKELEDNLKNRLKEEPKRKNSSYQRRRLTDASFDIEVENVDLFQTLMELKNKLSHSWERMYEYACKYYEHHGNLEVPAKFKTNNGFSYDEEGKIKLGKWIANQRIRVLPESERGQLLYQIGMRFSNKKSILSWKEMYEYACIYYKHYGHLEVPVKFKTNNGWEEDELGKINLGPWIAAQKQLYKNKEMSEEQIILLENIGMKWMSEKVDNKLQMEEITEKNTRKKQIELLNRTKSLLNHIDNQVFESKEDIARVNQQFIDELNRKSR